MTINIWQLGQVAIHMLELDGALSLSMSFHSNSHHSSSLKSHLHHSNLHHSIHAKIMCHVNGWSSGWHVTFLPSSEEIEGWIYLNSLSRATHHLSSLVRARKIRRVSKGLGHHRLPKKKKKKNPLVDITNRAKNFVEPTLGPHLIRAHPHTPWPLELQSIQFEGRFQRGDL